MPQNLNDNRSILVVDDSLMNRMLLTDILGDTYNVVEAEDGLQAVSILEESTNDIMLVLLDVNMPNMDGFEVLSVMNQRQWIQDIPVIMISAEDSAAYIERTYDLGVTDYVTKPFSAPVVLRRINNTVNLYSKQRRLVDMVSSQIYEKEKNTSLLVNILSHIVEFRNGESGLHILHIGTLTDILLRQLSHKTNKYDLSTSKRALITTASALHDIGKISIAEEVLNKPGRLTDEEFEQIKQHPVIGYEMLSDVPIGQENELVDIAKEICRWHHERYDGKGYPDGIAGDDIPISAQVVALADVYDALTSERCYKPAFTHDKALTMILNGECGTFNPLLLECLVEAADEIQEEISLVSPTQSNAEEFDHLVAEIQENEDLSVLNRSLDQLESERQKYDFIRQISSNYYFDYSDATDTIDFSAAAVQDLGVSPSIFNPRESKELADIFGEGEISHLFDQAFSTTPSQPELRLECSLLCDSKQVSGRFVVRTIWSQAGHDDQAILGIVGRLILD